MRRVLVVLLLAATLLVSGCGSHRLQDQVDSANRKQLHLTSSRSYLLMTWDDAPKEWLLISDQRPASSLHTMLTFNQGRMSLSSRAAIIEGQEISDPMAIAGYRESSAVRQERYERTRALLANGQKWTGNAVTTNISPYAVDYREAGTVTYQGREVQLLSGEVLSPRSLDPMSIYEHAHVIVGLDAKSGDLVLEYLVNLQPKASAANRMLVVHEPEPGVTLSIMAQTPAAERTVSYLRMYAELHALGGDLHDRYETLRS